MLHFAVDSSQIKSIFLTFCSAISYALLNPQGLLHMKLPSSSAEKLLQCKCCQIRVLPEAVVALLCYLLKAGQVVDQMKL